MVLNPVVVKLWHNCGRKVVCISGQFTGALGHRGVTCVRAYRVDLHRDFLLP